jgi:hypothetical protein
MLRLPAAALAVLTAAGCRSAPVQYDAARFDTPAKIAAEAPAFWAAMDVPQGALSSLATADGLRPRIAIAEFTLEFVTDKIQRPFKRQPAADTGEYGMVGLPVTLLGFGRVNVVYEETLKRNLPAELHSALRAELEKAGMYVIPLETVAASPSYARFVPARPGSTRWLDVFNIVGSDIGRTKRTEYWPAGGLVVVDGPSGGRLDEVEAAIMKELDADALLFVRLRIDVYEGRLAVGSGSRIRVVTGGREGSILSKSSLVSSDLVIDVSKWRLFKGRIYPVDGAKLAEAVREVWPPYAAMAVDVLTMGAPAK